MVAFSPTPRTLMGPGPSDVHPRILASMSKPTIGHLDPDQSVDGRYQNTDAKRLSH